MQGRAGKSLLGGLGLLVLALAANVRAQTAPAAPVAGPGADGGAPTSQGLPEPGGIAVACTYAVLSDAPQGEGIVLERGTATCGGKVSNVFILKVDMTTPGRFVTTRPAPSRRRRTAGMQGATFTLQLPTSFLESFLGPKNHGPVLPYRLVAQAVVDGNLSTNCCVYVLKNASSTATWLRGLEIAGGMTNAPIKANFADLCTASPTTTCFPFEFDATLLVDTDGRADIRRVDSAADLLPGLGGGAPVATAVTGSHMLVQQGLIVAPLCPPTGCMGEFYGPNSRTAVGLTADRNTLVMMVVDSVLGTGNGVQLDQLADLLRNRIEPAVDAAINLDGGGSSLMAVAPAFGRSSTIVNRPSHLYAVCDRFSRRDHATGGCERYLGNALLVGVRQPRPWPGRP